MKQSVLILTLLTTILLSCSSKQPAKSSDGELIDKKTVGLLPTEKQPDLEAVAEFKEAQVTGVTVSESGRLFANFPRWRDNVPYSVVEIFPDGTHRPYPDESWNAWDGKPQKNTFTCVQSVFAHENSLYVLDPSSPKMKGVLGEAKLYEFDLKSNKLKKTWFFNSEVAPEKSYLNDLRIDEKNRNIYITDSGIGGIVVLDLVTGKARRLLDNHPSTKAENVILTVDNKEVAKQMNVDGLALSPDNKLYYHALSGYTLYRVPASALNRTVKNETQLVKAIENLGETPAPDGMIFDKKGNLYMGDLERNAISYRTPEGELKILIQDERIKWPDTFTIDKSNNLIFTDSLLHDAQVGEPVEGMTFKIYKVSLPL
jgi:sugar lactone lactonase YvrE